MDDINSIVRFQAGSAPASEAKVETPAPAASETDKGDTAKSDTAAPPAAENNKAADTKQEDGAKAQPRDESGKFKAAEKEATAATAAEPAKPAGKPTGQLAALMAEREKRQQLERELADLKAGKTTGKPSVLEDEEGAFNARIDDGTRSLREQNFNLSMKVARLEYGEAFKDAEEAFTQAAMNDERLMTALRAQSDPGEYIYTVGLQIKELADVGGDFVKYREKITGSARAELAAKDERIKALEAELASTRQTQSARDEVPESLNRLPSGAVPARDGDATDINKIVRFKTG